MNNWMIKRWAEEEEDKEEDERGECVLFLLLTFLPPVCPRIG